jgi:hypothetical protein
MAISLFHFYPAREYRRGIGRGKSRAVLGACRSFSTMKKPAIRPAYARMERETGFEPATSTLARLHSTTELLPRMEAAPGFEPGDGGFADLCLTTWLCRLCRWSGRRDLNPRLQPWQGCTLPLSYSRSFETRVVAGWCFCCQERSCLGSGKVTYYFIGNEGI